MRKLANEKIRKLGDTGENCIKCGVWEILLRIMQNEGTVVKCLVFSELTLILRSPFALPSPCLRDGFEVASRGFWQR